MEQELLTFTSYEALLTLIEARYILVELGTSDSTLTEIESLISTIETYLETDEQFR